jgi:hypothetical protein
MYPRVSRFASREDTLKGPRLAFLEPANLHRSPPPLDRNTTRWRASVFTTDAGNADSRSAFGRTHEQDTRRPENRSFPDTTRY